MNLPAQSTNHLKKSISTLSVWFFIMLLLSIAFNDVLREMVGIWFTVEEYSHGFFIPIISIYFLWLRRGELTFSEGFKDSLPGFIITLIGLVLYLVGELATTRTIELYSFIVTVIGIFVIAFGWPGLRVGYVPLLFLIFMVPFPAIILNSMSLNLQLISSWLGVEFIRACDIPVYLQGNVIDLGIYKLQVVDACSGLRYLFPLASLSFLCAYLFNAPLWQKILVFLSSIPLTIFMNSFRIGVIGILVDKWGTKMAEGFLHDFEGWVVFLLCMVLLFIEMRLLSKLSGKNVSFANLVIIPREWSGHQKEINTETRFNKSLLILILMLCSTAVLSDYIQEKEDIIPKRKALLNFPLQIGKWHGQKEYLSQYYLNQLLLTDYTIINFVQPESGAIVNFYTAYYQSQRQGSSIHSPKACIPGDGWEITQFGQQKFADITVTGKPLEVNRAIIQKEDNIQVVYYWFQQQNRIITNEYMEKWFVLYDGLITNRTDGALVRLVTSVGNKEDIEIADQRLRAFLRDLMPELPAYLPGKSEY